MRDKAYQYLHKKIRSGELPAGAALSEASLARELGTSRTPLREAVGQLAAEGFLRQNPNGGSVVVEFSKRDIAELYELREALEGYAVAKAAEHDLRPADLTALQQSVSEILDLREELEQSGERWLNPAQMERFVHLDMRFHSTLVRSAANRRMLKVVVDARVLLNIFAMRRTGHDARLLTEVHRYHSEVLNAVCRKDPEAATRLLLEHIRVSKLERLRDHEEWELEKVMGENH
ncbi:MAG: GntR family transcriptional regulator [Acidobacteriota bacterium]|nr:GntR family transcriptional regulator [Acidobacteriota bacterium]